MAYYRYEMKQTEQERFYNIAAENGVWCYASVIKEIWISEISSEKLQTLFKVIKVQL